MNRILITGAAGAIGTTLRHGLADTCSLLRLTDLLPLEQPAGDEEYVAADLSDATAVMDMMSGIDCVVHLGGIPREAPWEAILPANIIGTWNVFEAARRSGVKRVIYASSNHVVGYYRTSASIGIEEPPRPDSRYGVSKVFGEALGRLYADKHGLSVACLRIGSFRPSPENARQLATWVSPRDLVQLVQRCIEAPAYHFLVLYGVSNNSRARWQNPAAELIGYAPQDDAESFAAEIEASSQENDEPAAAFHGGEFCAIEFDGDVGAID